MAGSARPDPRNPDMMLLDADAPGVEGGLLRFGRPVAIVEARRLAEVPAALARLDAAIDRGLQVAGFLAYELGYALEPALQHLLPAAGPLPLIHCGLYERQQVSSVDAADAWLRRRVEAEGAGGAVIDELRPLVARDEYRARFDVAIHRIHAGDLYQLNLAIPVAFRWRGDPLALYAQLRANQPVRHGGFVRVGSSAILSFSPELFFELAGGCIRSRPMKGTMRRGADAAEDDQLRRALQQDEKNRAENLMIVDLMRNDLARLCVPGSVEVEDLYRIETLPTLHQMTSCVAGRLAPHASLSGILRALFPAGSITGAPKIAAMRAIGGLERRPRGVYTGALGHVGRGADGQLAGRFNVAIRTLTLLPDGHGETFVGSGLVADSRGDAEYDECLLKYRFLMLPDYQLIETLALTGEGDYVLLERHLARLARSAAALGFRCPLDDLRKQLLATAAGLEGSQRVRLLLHPSGRFEITAVSFTPSPDEIVRVVVSDRRVRSDDPLIGHKTTRRQLYDGEWTRWHELRGAGEVLFLNERGELAEGSRSNLFIERRCELLTPPLASGLLPGTLREELIASGKARECVLRLDDLTGAEAVYVGNSVRGLQLAQLVA
jgi:para-aminobenzoate synthetase/4-amino-4-deoxychorismate lyase